MDKKRIPHLELTSNNEPRIFLDGVHCFNITEVSTEALIEHIDFSPLQDVLVKTKAALERARDNLLIWVDKNHGAVVQIDAALAMLGDA